MHLCPTFQIPVYVFICTVILLLLYELRFYCTSNTQLNMANAISQLIK